jgi:hypothetical protein
VRAIWVTSNFFLAVIMYWVAAARNTPDRGRRPWPRATAGL